MKTATYASMLLLLTFLYLPSTADAFSRRSSHSEVTQSQAVTSPLRTSSTENGDVSAQAVPEPPVLLLMSIGLGLFGLAALVKGFRKPTH